MDSSRAFGGSDLEAFLENCSHSFHETMVNFNQEAEQGRRPSPRLSYGEETGEEEFEPNPFLHPEKKRRLSPKQVQFLEKNFEVENKLEPERKVQLAKELRLQPRQVAIWFQNRRARFKTKQLEKDYGSLKASYDHVKANFDTLVRERDDLQNEVKSLMKKLKQKENLDPKNLDNPLLLERIHLEVTKKVQKVQAEDVSSTKSDVLDSESPLCNEAIYHSSQMEGPVDSTHIVEPYWLSDSSPNQVDRHLVNMGKSLVFLPTTQPLISNSGFSPVDDQFVWSWLN